MCGNDFSHKEKVAIDWLHFCYFLLGVANTTKWSSLMRVSSLPNLAILAAGPVFSSFPTYGADGPLCHFSR